MSSDGASQSGTIIFTDGASSGNPGPGGWGAIVATPDGRVEELGGGEPQTTNNRMELTAAVEALAAAIHHDTGDAIRLYVDSTYVIKGITRWIHAWKQNGWQTKSGNAVANQDLWERLHARVAKLETRATISWSYVRGHRGVPGNERADEIAVAYTRGEMPSLYRGARSAYTVDIEHLPEADEADPNGPRGTKGGRRTRGTPHSYLSLVNGDLRRHRTWPECERRVKGQAGARFKKAMTRQEEAEIVRAWGRRPEELDA